MFAMASHWVSATNEPYLGCCRTHLHSTAEIQAIKIKSLERTKGMVRLRFVAGGRLLSAMSCFLLEEASLNKASLGVITTSHEGKFLPAIICEEIDCAWPQSNHWHHSLPIELCMRVQQYQSLRCRYALGNSVLLLRQAAAISSVCSRAIAQKMLMHAGTGLWAARMDPGSAEDPSRPPAATQAHQRIHCRGRMHICAVNAATAAHQQWVAP